MNVQTTLLRINAVLFALFGIAFLAAPETISLLATGVAPGNVSFLVDMRATYGGTSIGIAIFSAFCAKNPAWVAPGLFGGMLVLTGIALGRIVGIVVDGSPNLFIGSLVLPEAGFALLLGWALKNLPVSEKGGAGR